ncbi:mercury methylation corrinoid protein HgcA [Acetobacterium wieringae]|uniref:mercury methylation corrinoid protein HgcA n=1 Tax=Acetobacterium wieringae TaxID=52694 RepID=UPI00315933B9
MPETHSCGCSDNEPDTLNQPSCCCQPPPLQSSEKPSITADQNVHWISGTIDTSIGSIPQITTKLNFKDVLGGWKVRWGIGRMNYKITPGLYGVGNPDQDSPILVSCNYKLSFDALRKELSGLNVWILVIDTRGINVWCAAGKGTFGTKEIVARLAQTRLSEMVSHRKIILPQLGAAGVKAQAVFKESEFRIIYGPVRASDIKTFLEADMIATDSMRTVSFTFYDRLVLTPIELVGTIKQSLMIFGVLLLLNFVIKEPFDQLDVGAYISAVLIGCVLTPVLLPFIPGRAFAFKGWLLGLLGTLAIIAANQEQFNVGVSLIGLFGYLLTFPAIAAYYAMNFTGSSTFVSCSGVQKEMRIAVPGLFFSIVAGVLLLLVRHLV